MQGAPTTGRGGSDGERRWRRGVVGEEDGDGCIPAVGRRQRGRRATGTSSAGVGLRGGRGGGLTDELRGVRRSGGGLRAANGRSGTALGLPDREGEEARRTASGWAPGEGDRTGGAPPLGEWATAQGGNEGEWGSWGGMWEVSVGLRVRVRWWGGLSRPEAWAGLAGPWPSWAKGVQGSPCLLFILFCLFFYFFSFLI